VSADRKAEGTDGPAAEVVEVSVVLTPRRPPQYRLEDLLQRVTEANLHDEADLGPPVGKETF
jgi:hypothetical protein